MAVSPDYTHVGHTCAGEIQQHCTHVLTNPEKGFKHYMRENSQPAHKQVSLYILATFQNLLKYY